MYETMKDSGIPWIGEVPAHWKITRSKVIFQNITVKNHPDATVLSLYRDLGVLPKKSRNDNHNVTSEDTAQYKFVEAGNLVINKMKAWQGSLAVSAYNGIVSPAYYVCKFRSNAIDKRYVHYLLRSSVYAQEFECLSTGMRIGQWDLGIDDFLKIPILLPDTDEQKSIADFLDAQCGRIDAIIDEAKASIEEYKRWKASMIYQAVTKGLDPDTPMKDSGIPWIGLIPEDWNVRRLKWILSQPLQYGANETGLDYNPSLPRYIRITDITADGKLTSSEMQSLNEDIAAPYMLKDEDILLARSGATVGKAFFYRAQYGKAAFAGYLIRATVNSKIVLPKYVYYSTLGSGYENWKESTSIQATIQNIGANRYNNYALAFPSLEKQRKLVDYLDLQCGNIDAIISEKQSLISELETYKKSLIYEAVTGKRNPREEAQS